VFNGFHHTIDKESVGVFVRFSCAASVAHVLLKQYWRTTTLDKLTDYRVGSYLSTILLALSILITPEVVVSLVTGLLLR
jgi:hypothetical protein